MARGDHIYVSMRAGVVPYQHHGIDMGDGTVIHLAPVEGQRLAIRDSGRNFSVRRVSLEEFCQGSKPHVVLHAGERTAEEIAAAAERELGKSGYNLVSGNCEHFATECATGQSRSHQIEMSAAAVSAMASLATKVACSVSSRISARLVVRGAMRAHPATWLADGVEVAALSVGCKQGFSAESSRRVARLSGTLAAAGIGAVLGGPAGAAAGVAMHQATARIGDQVSLVTKKVLS